MAAPGKRAFSEVVKKIATNDSQGGSVNVSGVGPTASENDSRILHRTVVAFQPRVTTHKPSSNQNGVSTSSTAVTIVGDSDGHHQHHEEGANAEAVLTDPSGSSSSTRGSPNASHQLSSSSLRDASSSSKNMLGLSRSTSETAGRDELRRALRHFICASYTRTKCDRLAELRSRIHDEAAGSGAANGNDADSILHSPNSDSRPGISGLPRRTERLCAALNLEPFEIRNCTVGGSDSDAADDPWNEMLPSLQTEALRLVEKHVMPHIRRRFGGGGGESRSASSPVLLPQVADFGDSGSASSPPPPPLTLATEASITSTSSAKRHGMETRLPVVVLESPAATRAGSENRLASPLPPDVIEDAETGTVIRVWANRSAGRDFVNLFRALSVARQALLFPSNVCVPYVCSVACGGLFCTVSFVVPITHSIPVVCGSDANDQDSSAEHAGLVHQYLDMLRVYFQHFSDKYEQQPPFEVCGGVDDRLYIFPTPELHRFRTQAITRLPESAAFERLEYVSIDEFQLTEAAAVPASRAQVAIRDRLVPLLTKHCVGLVKLAKNDTQWLSRMFHVCGVGMKYLIVVRNLLTLVSGTGSSNLTEKAAQSHTTTKISDAQRRALEAMDSLIVTEALARAMKTLIIRQQGKQLPALNSTGSGSENTSLQTTPRHSFTVDPRLGGDDRQLLNSPASLRSGESTSLIATPPPPPSSGTELATHSPPPPPLLSPKPSAASFVGSNPFAAAASALFQRMLQSKKFLGSVVMAHVFRKFEDASTFELDLGMVNIAVLVRHLELQLGIRFDVASRRFQDDPAPAFLRSGGRDSLDIASLTKDEAILAESVCHRAFGDDALQRIPPELRGAAMNAAALQSLSFAMVAVQNGTAGAENIFRGAVARAATLLKGLAKDPCKARKYCVFSLSIGSQAENQVLLWKAYSQMVSLRQPLASSPSASAAALQLVSIGDGVVVHRLMPTLTAFVEATGDGAVAANASAADGGGGMLSKRDLLYQALVQWCCLVAASVQWPRLLPSMSGAIGGPANGTAIGRAALQLSHLLGNSISLNTSSSLISAAAAAAAGTTAMPCGEGTSDRSAGVPADAVVDDARDFFSDDSLQRLTVALGRPLGTLIRQQPQLEGMVQRCMLLVAWCALPLPAAQLVLRSYVMRKLVVLSSAAAVPAAHHSEHIAVHRVILRLAAASHDAPGWEWVVAALLYVSDIQRELHNSLRILGSSSTSKPSSTVSKSSPLPKASSSPSVARSASDPHQSADWLPTLMTTLVDILRDPQTLQRLDESSADVDTVLLALPGATTELMDLLGSFSSRRYGECVSKDAAVVAQSLGGGVAPVEVVQLLPNSLHSLVYVSFALRTFFFFAQQRERFYASEAVARADFDSKQDTERAKFEAKELALREQRLRAEGERREADIKRREKRGVELLVKMREKRIHDAASAMISEFADRKLAAIREQRQQLADRLFEEAAVEKIQGKRAQRIKAAGMKLAMEGAKAQLEHVLERRKEREEEEAHRAEEQRQRNEALDAIRTRIEARKRAAAERLATELAKAKAEQIVSERDALAALREQQKAARIAEAEEAQRLEAGIAALQQKREARLHGAGEALAASCAHNKAEEIRRNKYGSEYPNIRLKGPPNVNGGIMASLQTNTSTLVPAHFDLAVAASLVPVTLVPSSSPGAEPIRVLDLTAETATGLGLASLDVNTPEDQEGGAAATTNVSSTVACDNSSDGMMKLSWQECYYLCATGYRQVPLSRKPIPLAVDLETVLSTLPLSTALVSNLTKELGATADSSPGNSKCSTTHSSSNSKPNDAADPALTTLAMKSMMARLLDSSGPNGKKGGSGPAASAADLSAASALLLDYSKRLDPSPALDSCVAGQSPQLLVVPQATEMSPIAFPVSASLPTFSPKTPTALRRELDGAVDGSTRSTSVAKSLDSHPGGVLPPLKSAPLFDSPGCAPRGTVGDEMTNASLATRKKPVPHVAGKDRRAVPSPSPGFQVAPDAAVPLPQQLLRLAFTARSLRRLREGKPAALLLAPKTSANRLTAAATNVASPTEELSRLLSDVGKLFMDKTLFAAVVDAEEQINLKFQRDLVTYEAKREQLFLLLRSPTTLLHARSCVEEMLTASLKAYQYHRIPFSLLAMSTVLGLAGAAPLAAVVAYRCVRIALLFAAECLESAECRGVSDESSVGQQPPSLLLTLRHHALTVFERAPPASLLRSPPAVELGALLKQLCVIPSNQAGLVSATEAKLLEYGGAASSLAGCKSHLDAFSLLCRERRRGGGAIRSTTPSSNHSGNALDSLPLGDAVEWTASLLTEGLGMLASMLEHASCFHNALAVRQVHVAVASDVCGERSLAAVAAQESAASKRLKELAVVESAAHRRAMTQKP